MNFSGGVRRVTSVTILVLAAGGGLVAGAAGAVAAPSAVPGSVTQVPGVHGCYTTDGSGSTGPGVCTNIRGGAGSTTVSISPDGRSAYLVGYGGDANAVLSVFSRNPNTGVLTQLAGKAGCLSDDGTNEGVP